MGESVKLMFTRLIRLTDQIFKAARRASGFEVECAKIASGTTELVAVLHQAASPGSRLYEQPARRIILETEQVLEDALSLILRCNRFITLITASIMEHKTFRDLCSQIDSSIKNFIWLLRISSSADVGWYTRYLSLCYLSLPPLAANEPILVSIWVQIAKLSSGSADVRSDAAASLISLISDNDIYCELVTKEGGAEPLLKLVKDGNLDTQKNAAKAIGLLAQIPDCGDQLLSAGLCSVFEKILKEGPMAVQAVVAWTVSELARNHLKCRDAFAQKNITRLLVAHLAFETVHDHIKYEFVINKGTSVRAVVNATADKKERALGLDLDDDQGLNHSEIRHANHMKLENSATKADMKAMAARALWQLAKGNLPTCKSISGSRALMCFVALLEKGAYEVRYNSALALMEITSVAEKDGDLRRSVFKPNSPVCKAVVDQLLRAIENEKDPKILVACIRAVGNLATTWTAGTRMSTPLVKFLGDREDEVSREAILTLTKLACPENYLHVDHSKAIISAPGGSFLFKIRCFRIHNRLAALSLRLLCYISRHIPDSDQTKQRAVFHVLSWASKQAFVKQDRVLASLIDEAKSRVEWKCP